MAERCGAAIPGLPVADTLKHVSSDGIVMDTPDRSAFMRVQTPQGFRADVVRRAYAVARERGTTATDCSSVVEQLGSHVSIVPGEETNFKITTPYDLRVATFLLANSDR
jgi:2-C-methyl-D-erythritol 4-phosphate cytidylyltransferase